MLLTVTAHVGKSFLVLIRICWWFRKV